MGILKALLVFLLVGFALGQVARFNIGNNIAITLMDIAVIGIVVNWLFTKPKVKTFFPSFHSPLTKPLCLFLGICLISLLLNPLQLSNGEMFQSSLYLIRFIMYSGIYFAIRKISKNNKAFLEKGLVVAGIFILVVGFIQYFFYPHLINLSYLGWDDHLYRMFSVFLDPNFTGVILSLFFFFLCGILFKNKITKQKYYGLSVLLLFTFLAIFLTHSRTALLTLTGGSVVFFFMINKKKWVLGIGAALIFLIAAASPFFYIENINIFRTSSSTARIVSFSRAVRIYQENPILGIGFNTFAFAQRRYGYSEEIEIPAHSEAGTDNSLLFVLVTTGAIGLSAYLYLLFVIVKIGLLYSSHETQKIQRAVLTATMVGLLISSFFLNTLFYTAIMLWIWTLLGLTENK